MSKLKIKIKSKYSNYSDGMPAAFIEKEARSVQEEAQLLPDCAGVYWDITTDWEGYTTYSWIFYRYETDTEYQLRKKKETVYDRIRKVQQYEDLKKELGL